MSAPVFACGVLVSLASVLVGCAFSPHTVVLQPTVGYQDEDIGHKRPIALRIVDERPGTAYGHRLSGYGPAAEIRGQEGDVVNVFHKSIREALVRRGFSIASDGRADTTLRIEVRSIEYSGSIGFFTAGIRVQVAAKAMAGGTCNYEHFYRSDDEERIVVTPTAESDAAHINRVVSAVIQSIVSDRLLFACLAGVTPY